jgi:hypothetical protein
MNIPYVPSQASERDVEDALFAFQERLFSVMEIEIVTEDGETRRVLPTRLNRYLQIPEEAPDGDWVPVSPKATYATAIPSDSDSLAGDEPQMECEPVQPVAARTVASALFQQYSSGDSD